MLIFSVSFHTLTDTRNAKKGNKNTDVLRAVQMLTHVSPDSNAVDQTAERPRTREFPQEPED